MHDPDAMPGEPLDLDSAAKDSLLLRWALTGASQDGDAASAVYGTILAASILIASAGGPGTVFLTVIGTGLVFWLAHAHVALMRRVVRNGEHIDRARVRQAEASVQKARVDLNRTVIRSPVAGTVIDRKIEPGQTVAASFTAPELFRIARDLRQMQVKADVSEADVGRVSLGQKVTFTVDAYPDEKFKGKVTQVRSAPTTAQTK